MPERSTWALSDPTSVFLYFEVEQKLDAGWNLNEFVYLDNVLIVSDSIQGDLGPAPLTVGPQGKAAVVWGALKALR
ncbi:MAG: hypothetical protein KatS3mg115_1435 [Candidatus Poribacteria bacterium]|nr:MAG: hypothetical protein KatS3mg115_1435 [Candidatus Poribacteria bacterium]